MPTHRGPRRRTATGTVRRATGLRTLTVRIRARATLPLTLRALVALAALCALATLALTAGICCAVSALATVTVAIVFGPCSAVPPRNGGDHCAGGQNQAERKGRGRLEESRLGIKFHFRFLLESNRPRSIKFRFSYVFVDLCQSFR